MAELANCNTEQFVDKIRVANCFGKAANDYDKAAEVQHISGHKLEAMVPNCKSILDLGCGTGYHLGHLAGKCDNLIAADISLAMLHKARDRNIDSCDYLQVDAEQLSLKSPSVSCIFSNMALQWCNSLQNALNECYSVLTPNGSMVFTTLLDGTLTELKQSWSAVNNDQHVNEFLTLQQVKDAIAQTNFTIEQLVVTKETIEYRVATDLLRDLKAIGANHVPGRERHGFTPRSEFKAMLTAYENFRDSSGLLPASYEVCYIRLNKSE